MASSAVVLLVLCACLAASVQGAAFGRPMHNAPVDAPKPVVGKLNLAAVKKEPVVVGVNKQALAALVTKQEQEEPVSVTLNKEALAKLAAPKLVSARLNMEALAKLNAEEPVVVTLNKEALAKLAAPKLVSARLNTEALQNIAAEANPMPNLAASELDAIQDVIQTKFGKSVKLTDFSFQDCGAASNAAHVQQLSISPDPIAIPGNVTVSLKASLSRNESSPISLSLKIQKKTKIGTWLTIPCVDDVGSCTYPDICALLEKIPLVDGQCPEEMQAYNVPCRCPIPAAQLSVSGISVAIPEIPPSVPAGLLDGDFQINVQMNGNAGQILCLNVIVSLSDNS